VFKRGDCDGPLLAPANAYVISFVQLSQRVMYWGISSAATGPATSNSNSKTAPSDIARRSVPKNPTRNSPTISVLDIQPGAPSFTRETILLPNRNQTSSRLPGPDLA